MCECVATSSIPLRLGPRGVGGARLILWRMDRCEECGFEYDPTEAATAAASITVGVAEVAAILGRNDANLRARLQPAVWSPLEYGCHVRDVLLVQRERVLTARRTLRHTFAPMGREERVEHDGYAQQEPADVARQLTMAAQLFVNVLDRLGADDWDRSVMYGYPDRTERSLRWVAVHTLHEVRHHLFDIRRQLAES